MPTVYQLDDQGLLQGDPPYARQAPTKGHLQVLAAPPEVPAGHVARWATALHPVIDTKTYGDPDTGSWEIIEDHRKDELWIAHGRPYTLGDDVDGQTYGGLGPLPGWLYAEEPPAPEPEPPGPPTVVTRAQGKAALIQAGLWDSVLAYVDGIADPTQQALARVALDDTTEWRRDSPFLTTAAAALGLTDKQLDDLFVAAAAIVL